MIGQTFTKPLEVEEETKCSVQVLDDDHEEIKTSREAQIVELAKQMASKPTKAKVQASLDQFGFC
jgi:uncharacterized protein YciW